MFEITTVPDLADSRLVIPLSTSSTGQLRFTLGLVTCPTLDSALAAI
jgi:hypothetical protein